MSGDSQSTGKFPANWLNPPAPLATPELDELTDLVLACLSSAIAIRRWAEHWPARANCDELSADGVSVPAIDHVCALNDLMSALSTAEPLFEACRSEFAATNAENPLVAGRRESSFHNGAIRYSMLFPQCAAQCAGTLLMHGPPHPTTGEAAMDIPGLSNLSAEGFVLAVKELPAIDYDDLVASLERESSRAQQTRTLSAHNNRTRSPVDPSSETAGEPKRDNVATMLPGLASCKQCEVLAWRTEQYAITQNGEFKRLRTTYEWIEEYFDPDSDSIPCELFNYELPHFDTWSRYVRAVRKATGTQVNQQRANRFAGKSIVRETDI